MSAIVLAALDRELDLRDWKARLGEREKTDLGVDASELLAEERQIQDLDPV
ncbi:MAG: hypothetical protein OXP37_02260 [Chloroflexota bacterium]|nr:hypothetical protein [Chloroflexota bacterium]